MNDGSIALRNVHVESPSSFGAPNDAPPFVDSDTPTWLAVDPTQPFAFDVVETEYDTPSVPFKNDSTLGDCSCWLQ